MAQGKKTPKEVVEAARAAATDDAAAAPLQQERVDAMQATADMNRVEFGSEAHERRLSSAYDGLTREDAQRIISEREKDPHLWPWDKYQQAKKFLAELDGKPKPVATNKHWTRDQVGT